MWLIIGKYTINNATPIENIAIDTFAIIDGRVFQQPPPITRTCRVLQREFLPYYYETKIDIDFDHIPIDYATETFKRSLNVFIDCIGYENRRPIRGGVQVHQSAFAAIRAASAGDGGAEVRQASDPVGEGPGAG